MGMSTTDTEPSHRGLHSNRFRNDLWEGVAEDVTRLAETDGLMNQTLWITQAMEARLDYLRCPRCRIDKPAVPVEFRDLTGKPFSDWIMEATREIAAQHPWHVPVVIGAVSQAAAPVPEQKATRARKAPVPVAANGDKAAAVESLRSQIDEVTERMKPARKRSAAPVRFEDGTGEQAAW